MVLGPVLISSFGMSFGLAKVNFFNRCELTFGLHALLGTKLRFCIESELEL
jgi:hypothetical protein